MKFVDCPNHITRTCICIHVYSNTHYKPLMYTIKCTCIFLWLYVHVCILHLCFSCVFPEPSLTPENLSTVLDSMEDRLWGVFSHYVNIPASERMRIEGLYSSARECRRAVINSLISTHPAPSWRLVAHALYQMGPYGASCLRALDHLQQLFPTGTYTMVCIL